MQRITSITEFRARTGADAPTEAEEALTAAALAGTRCVPQRVQVSGSVYLRVHNGTPFRSNGAVSLAGAEIGGQLDCTGASLTGANLLNAETDGAALVAHAMTVGGEFVWRNVACLSGKLDLSSADVSDLTDDLASWPDGGRVDLNGFSYDRISSHAPVDTATRLAWLLRVDHAQGKFVPQPYTQLARVLAAAGHDRAARKILQAREQALAADHFAGDEAVFDSLRNSDDQSQRGDMGKVWLRMHAARFWSGLIRRVAGYGCAPERALYWALALWAISTLVYFVCYRLGAMVPNSDIIIASQAFADAVAIDPIAPGLIWAALPFANHYETFYAGAYALDVLLPIVDLGQQGTWSATTVTWLGWTARIWTFGLDLAGWFITALGAAAITGIIQKDRD